MKVGASACCMQLSGGAPMALVGWECCLQEGSEVSRSERQERGGLGWSFFVH